MTGDATVHRRWRVRLRRRSACRKRRCLPRRKDSDSAWAAWRQPAEAVSGAVMLAGFKNSCADPKNPKTKAATYQLTEITRQFAEKNHALVCKGTEGGNRRGFAELSGLYPRCGCDRGKYPYFPVGEQEVFIIRIKSKQSRCPCGRVVFHTGTFVI